MGGDVLSCLFFLAVGVVSVANPQTLELILSPRNPFGGFSSWLVLCLMLTSS